MMEPITKATMPPSPSAPNDGTNDSATISSTPSAINASPAKLTDSTWNANSASSRLIAPTTPGSTVPG